MNYSEIISLGKKVIKIESEAVESLINKLDENFAKAVELILNSKGRVVYTGMGKSGLIARKIVATMNSTGTAAIYMHPTDALHVLGEYDHWDEEAAEIGAEVLATFTGIDKLELCSNVKEQVACNMALNLAAFLLEGVDREEIKNIIQ